MQVQVVDQENIFSHFSQFLENIEEIFLCEVVISELGIAYCMAFVMTITSIQSVNNLSIFTKQYPIKIGSML